MLRKKVIIIGGGFAGLHLARKLDKNFFDILLIDKVNHHQFQPLFYQVATSQIEPSSISFPLRYIFKNNNNVQIRLANVQKINPIKNEIETDIGFFLYDYLVIATGCKTNFYNNNELEKHVFTLKTTYDAIKIRNHILTIFEKACYEKNESLLNLVIVGAGPTGVELAGAFAEIRKNVLSKDYHGIDFNNFKIYLIEGSSSTLNYMSPKAKKASAKFLQKMGVVVYTDTILKNYKDDIAFLSNNLEIKTKTIIWAAGVTGCIINGIENTNITNSNRYIVDHQNKITNSGNVYAIGDVAYMQTSKYNNGHPQVANVAINQAKLLAKNLKNIETNKILLPFEYKDLGTMATIGNNKAVVDLPILKFTGFFAWLAWMFLHLMLILSTKNKLIIFIDWTWKYITKNSSLRLILKDSEQNNN